MATNFRTVLEALLLEDVEMVVVGGVALVARGAPRTTEDIDLCYQREDDNLERLARALSPLNPHLRGAPAGLPFIGRTHSAGWAQFHSHHDRWRRRLARRDHRTGGL